MANYESYCRTNYVKVRDKARLMDAINEVNGLELIEQDDKVGFIIDEGFIEVKDPESCKVVDASLIDEDSDISIVHFLAPFMEDKEVCVMQHIGHEKMRYLTGAAIAFDNTKKIVSVCIDDIYRLAEKEFGSVPNSATY